MSMSDTGEVNRPDPNVIRSDQELREYLEDSMRGASRGFDTDPVLTYSSARDFSVEPLETDAAVFMVNTFLEDISADTQNDQVISCWTPNKTKNLDVLQERLDQWGYAVTKVSRTNRSSRLTPVIECVARRSPDELDQFRVLSEVISDPVALLDGWAVVIQNQHRLPQEKVRVSEWADIRGTSPEAVKENIQVVADALRDAGGIPGTQWAIKVNHGTPLRTKRSN